VRNAQATRYARWAALAAVLLAVIVGGVFLYRQVRAHHEEGNAAIIVPNSVQQQSDVFAFSKVEQARTIFTVRAAHFTQYKDQNRAVLEDVWITIYGRDGSRNDNIHTRECSYQPLSGDVRCEGEVQIDLQSAKQAGQSPAPTHSSQFPIGTLHVKTRDLKFNRETGIASTTELVDFTFPQGTGSGKGMTYSTSDATVTVQQDVRFDLAASDKTGGQPISVTGNSLEVRRNDRTVVLNGPAIVRQGKRELTAEKLTLWLDQTFHADHAAAEGHPAIRVADPRGAMDLSADKFEATLDAQGWIENIVADGNVTGTRNSAKGADHFSAARFVAAMQPQHNILKDMTASGGVIGESQEGPDSRKLQTEALRMVFSPAEKSGEGPEKQRIESAETLAPATIESKTGTDATELRAKKFVATFSSEGRLAQLQGHSGVEVTSKTSGKPPQVTSAQELAATFGAKGDWDTLEETGNVQFQQGDRRATASHARIDRAADIIAMDGSPVLSDSSSRTTVGSVQIHQKTGQMDANGGVVSTYIPGGKGGEVNLGSGTAHITAESLTGSTTTAHVIYQGHARLWQGDSVLQADKIEIWREEKKLQASGHVVAAFPQTGSFQVVPTTAQSGLAANLTPGAVNPNDSSPVAMKTRSQASTLWEIRAPLLTYWDVESKAELEGGVTAESQQGSIQSQKLDAFLSKVQAATQPRPNGSPKASTQLSRVIAQGDVVVRQGGIRATSERADYTAAEGKFVLSGGNPTIVDASGDTTTGHSLTFFLASDTILVDSDSSSRTLTKHRVEK
jgi:lipopolysaccharide export system protein LptA